MSVFEPGLAKIWDGLVEVLQMWPLDLPNLFQEQFPNTLTTEHSPNWSREAAGAGGWLVVGGAWQSVAEREWVGLSWGFQSQTVI